MWYWYEKKWEGWIKKSETYVLYQKHKVNLQIFNFRESYCCQPYRCPSENCEIPLLDHVRRIVHDHGSIFISLRKLSNCVPGGDKDIMMWNWCRKCRQVSIMIWRNICTYFLAIWILKHHLESFDRKTDLRGSTWYCCVLKYHCICYMLKQMILLSCNIL